MPLCRRPSLEGAVACRSWSRPAGPSRWFRGPAVRVTMPGPTGRFWPTARSSTGRISPIGVIAGAGRRLAGSGSSIRPIRSPGSGALPVVWGSRKVRMLSLPEAISCRAIFEVTDRGRRTQPLPNCRICRSSQLSICGNRAARGQAGSHPHPLAAEGCFFFTVFSSTESWNDFLRRWKQRKIPVDAVGKVRRSAAA